MREAGAAPFYRRGELRAVTGETLRPGGTDLTERAFNLAGLTPGARLLDLGCGPGASLTLARERFCAKPVGLDFSAAMLAEAKARRPGLRLVRADALALPFRAASFEVVLCECVLSLLPDPAPVLADIARCLAPGGRLVWADLCRREAPLRRAPAGGDGASCLAGAPALPLVPALVAAAGLHVLVLEDHSKALAELAGRLIFAGIPPAELFGAVPGGCAGRPGYFLMIAAKEEE
jgi:SAM-dependent methyltransferase